MPAVSVDTFFACSLMVIIVLSAMAYTSMLLCPHINNAGDANTAKRYGEASKYLLLNDGTPANWGQDGQSIPEIFGLAKADSGFPYELDIDKVSRLNSENSYALSYAQIFATLQVPDMSIRIEIKPVFEVVVNLTATFEMINETVYQFEIFTERHGIPISTELKCYAIAEDYLETTYAHASDGRTDINVTIPNNVDGSALFTTIAKTVCNSKIVSFGTFAFAHNSSEPEPNGTFLRLSPLNYSLTASFIYPGINLSRAYALSFNYSSVTTETSCSNQSATYSVPHYLDPSPTLIVLTGWNSTAFFTEWTVYPQIPLQIGTDFAGSTALSNVFSYSYIVAINSALYECTFWLGGPRD